MVFDEQKPISTEFAQLGIKNFSEKVKMNFAIFLILSCMCVYHVTAFNIKVYGQVTQNVMGMETVLRDADVQAKNYTFSFEQVTFSLAFIKIF